ncbi:MAG TPA: VOC family protein [Stellaceae bacterium]|nr:VOC family protein [Stellaceae bacterium]
MAIPSSAPQRPVAREARPRSLSIRDKAVRKLIAAGGHAYFAAVRLLYRLQFPWRGKLGHLDHITIPTTDLRVAEEFYVGLLGARVALRIDRPMLMRMGWSEAEIERNHAVHLSVMVGGGPRLDLFDYPDGMPRAAMHPHIAIAVAPGHLLAWKNRLSDRGVIVVGPTRVGPPGQASIYFDDPFGNHLELVTTGFVAEDVPAEMPDRSRLSYAWRSAGMTSRA